MARCMSQLIIKPRNHFISTVACRLGSMKLSNTMESYNERADARVYAPAAGRNKQPICDVISRFLSPASAAATASSMLMTPAHESYMRYVLEVACGTGEHTATLAKALPGLTFQPTDCTPELFASVQAHSSDLSNVLEPRLVDATRLADEWATAGAGAAGQLLAIVCINMTHISPWEATLGLLEGAGETLSIPNFTYLPVIRLDSLRTIAFQGGI